MKPGPPTPQTLPGEPTGDPIDIRPIGIGIASGLAPVGGDLSTVYESEQSYRDRLEAMSLSDLLPSYTTTGSGVTHTGSLVAAPNVYVRNLDEDGVGQNLMTVALLDVGDSAGGPTTTTTVAGYGGTVYASTDALYLASSIWQDDGGEETRLFKFGLGADAISLEATGTVVGSVLDQFGMDEFGGHFRIATNNWSDAGPASHLYVLDEVGDTLQMIGSVRNIARGEQLQSVRFDGDQAYLVTFRQVDPLFTVDLTDAAHPRIAGELKMPGYSSYLQPIGDGLMIGIGRSISEDGVNDQGLQLSLFDVASSAAPKRLATYSLPDAYSDAEYDHHAFAYFSDEHILAAPVQTDADDDWSSSLIVLKLDPQSRQITPLGEVRSDGQMQRSLRIDDTLYAVSTNMITAVKLQNPAAIVKAIRTVAD